jgi:L-ascorbate metabolism protein UlaG (beta-lactamase superfamily)
MIVKILPLFITNKEERVPRRPLGPFHTDPRIFETPPPTGLRITWMGHSTNLIELDGKRILTDPVWEQRASPVQWAGPKRFFAPTITLEKLPPIDVVLLSHDHYDHFGAETISRLARLPNISSARWITTLKVGRILQSLGVNAARIQELDWTETATLPNLTITALPARHFSGRSFFNRFETLWASYVLSGSHHRVYYGADSGEWPGFAEIGQQHGPFHLTMLEIGAFHPLWADIHMGPDGAARSFRAMNAGGLLMPIHWALFDLALHAWDQPIQRVFEIEDLKLWSPVPGIPTDVIPDIELRSDWWRKKLV